MAPGSWKRRPVLPLRFAVDAEDRHRRLGTVAVVGLLLSATMAVLGLPPVDLHGPQHYVGIMAPTCGGTRAVREVLLGHPGLAWRYNPLGPPAVLGAVAVLAREALGRTSGRWVNLRAVHRPTAAVLLPFAVGALETHQQAQAALVGPRNGAVAPGSPILYGLVVFLVACGACAFWLHKGGVRPVHGSGPATAEATEPAAQRNTPVWPRE